MKADRIQYLADMLNGMAPAARERMLESIRQEDATLAKYIEERLLSFNDLQYLSVKDWQRLVQASPQSTMQIALRGAEAGVVNACLASMSQRAASCFQEDMEQLGPQPLSKVEAARKEILDWVKRQQSEGRLSLLKGDDWI